MASAIDSIYDWIEGLSPTYDSDITVAIRKHDALRDQLHADDLPVRMLIIPDEAVRGDLSYVALGPTVSITWTIVDRLFIRVAGMGEGLPEHTDKVIQYAKSYIAAAQADRSPTSQSDISSLEFVPKYLEWPAGSGVWFVGIDVILTIEEFCSG